MVEPKILNEAERKLIKYLREESLRCFNNMWDIMEARTKGQVVAKSKPETVKFLCPAMVEIIRRNSREAAKPKPHPDPQMRDINERCFGGKQKPPISLVNCYSCERLFHNSGILAGVFICQDYTKDYPGDVQE